MDSRLQAAAQAHAADTAARNYYEHNTPEGLDPGDRMQKAGYGFGAWGENIHQNPKNAAAAMKGWMESSGHRSNILNCAFKDIGVGVDLGSNGPWWVQDFRRVDLTGAALHPCETRAVGRVRWG
ncbi:CAP domain-containing protein [Kitasatospora sp. NPDC048365]|uniref:CAP domain-containing protein n=1 Tax=Kitasatospora sp. NPDC048365 TaxID=3364050 RepID=UPI0037213FBE